MFKIFKITSNTVVDFAAEELKKYLRMMMPFCGEYSSLVFVLFAEAQELSLDLHGLDGAAIVNGDAEKFGAARGGRLNDNAVEARMLMVGLEN